jgi:hypothetical protein
VSFTLAADCAHAPVDDWTEREPSNLRPASTAVRHYAGGVRLVSPVACMIVLLHAFHTPHTPAAELVLAFAHGYTRYITLLLFIPRAALAVTSCSAASSIGACIAAEAPVAVWDMLVDVESSGFRELGAFVRTNSFARSPCLLLMQLIPARVVVASNHLRRRSRTPTTPGSAVTRSRSSCSWTLSPSGTRRSVCSSTNPRRRREPGGVPSISNLGECKVCLTFSCFAHGEAQICR